MTAPAEWVTWVVTGAPAREVRMDGTMAYLSLPESPEDPGRGDIWLEDPVVRKISPTDPLRSTTIKASSAEVMAAQMIVKRAQERGQTPDYSVVQIANAEPEPGTGHYIVQVGKTDDALPVHRDVTAIEFSCFPLDHEDRRHFTLTVEWRGRGKWAVCSRGYCWSDSAQKFEYESLPSNRRDEWLADHRFDRERAEAIATAQAPLITVNGHTVPEVLALAAREQQHREES